MLRRGMVVGKQSSLKKVLQEYIWSTNILQIQHFNISLPFQKPLPRNYEMCIFQVKKAYEVKNLCKSFRNLIKQVSIEDLL